MRIVRTYCISLLVVASALSGCIGNRPDGATDSSTLRFDMAPIRRLTATQYANTVVDLFGTSLLVPTLQVTDVGLDGMVSAGSSQVSIPPADALAFTQAAASIARQITAVSYRGNLGCTPSGAGDASCATVIVNTWGKKIYRRPLNDAQRAAYVALVTTNSDFYTGVQNAFGAMLQSPYFLFRIDATDTAATDPNAFDDYAIAGRLSYLIWNSTPDDALIAAADAKQLSTPAGLAAQADRMLADPRANPALYNFFYEMLGLGGIATAQKNPNDFNATIAADMQTQIQLTVTDVVLNQNADYRSLFVTHETFVNQNLAALYGYPKPSNANFTQITYTAQDRAGLFGMPGMATMLSPSSRTSPTQRGEYIRGTLLCTSVPSAPPGVNTSVTQDPNTPQTMRQLMSNHASNASCAACHNMMDPLGFALEGFDEMGRYRTSESGLPLDLTGTLDSTAFSNATTFGTALASDPSLPGCMTQKFVEYASGSTVNASTPSVQAMGQAFANSNYSVKALVKAYVTSAYFTRAN